MTTQQKVFEVKQANPSYGYDKIARALNMHRNVVRYHLSRAYKQGLFSKPTYQARLTKREAVDMLGGKCRKCGYDKHLAALEFHHKDPSAKDFTLARAFTTGISRALALAELNKCELLCANCHRIEHAKRTL